MHARRTTHAQVGVLVVSLGMLNNGLYVVIGRESARDPKGANPEQQQMMVHLWAWKSAVSFCLSLAVLVCMFWTLASLVQLVIMLCIAITIDPYRPLSIVLLVLTAVFYITNVVQMLIRLRKAFVKEITARYLEKTKSAGVGRVPPRQKKLNAARKLQQCIHEELEAVGLSTEQIALSVALAVLLVLLLVSVILLTQSLFFASRDQGPIELVATVLPCILVVVSSLEDKIKEEKQTARTVKGIEKVVKEVVKGADKGLEVTTDIYASLFRVSPKKMWQDKVKAMKAEKTRKAAAVKTAKNLKAPIEMWIVPEIATEGKSKGLPAYKVVLPEAMQLAFASMTSATVADRPEIKK